MRLQERFLEELALKKINRVNKPLSTAYSVDVSVGHLEVFLCFVQDSLQVSIDGDEVRGQAKYKIASAVVRAYQEQLSENPELKEKLKCIFED